ncbi:unnamed protein product [Mesocestoides corti]|uniref:Uncharacterized protein n=1 Tax=Mesocestoides corti TaxID=53468 RepID=A0A0R3UDH6_MESCO|nr:unnamed protein product [Mesocestoides corti]
MRNSCLMTRSTADDSHGMHISIFSTLSGDSVDDKIFSRRLSVRAAPLLMQIEIIYDPKSFSNEFLFYDHTRTWGDTSVSSTAGGVGGGGVCGSGDGVAALAFLIRAKQQSPAKQQLDHHPHYTMTGDDIHNLNQQIHHQTGPSTNADTPLPPQASSLQPSNPNFREPVQQLSRMSESFLPPGLTPRVRCIFLVPMS